MEQTLSKEKSAIPVKNFLKVRVLLFLNRQKESVLKEGIGNHWAWCAIPDIALGIGLSKDHRARPGSLYVVIPRWANNPWGYVDSYSFTAAQMPDSRPHTFYRINAKGEAYLRRLDKWYGYIKEAQAALDDSKEDSIPMLYPIRMHWPAYPGSRQDGVWIMWPFTSKRDAGPCFLQRSKEFMFVEDIDEALNVARGLFHIEPKQECVNYALAIQKHYAEKAGYKLVMKR